MESTRPLPVPQWFLISASEMFVGGCHRCSWWPLPPAVFHFFSSVLSSAHLLMQRQAKLLSYEKIVNPTNNKLFQMLKVQRFREVAENFSRKNKKNCGKGLEINRPKAFNCLRGECVPFDLANHLPGAAVAAGCVDGTLLAGVVTWSWVGLTSCVPFVGVASIIKLLVVGEKAVICCFGLSLGVNSS